SDYHGMLHSFPTRRSSDLTVLESASRGGSEARRNVKAGPWRPTGRGVHSPVKTAVGGARDLLTSPAGVLAFRRTGRTPHGTYRVMRKTLSVAPRLAPRAYRLVLPTPTARPETDPTGLLDRLGAGDAHSTAEELRSDGFVRFDGL